MNLIDIARVDTRGSGVPGGYVGVPPPQIATEGNKISQEIMRPKVTKWVHLGVNKQGRPLSTIQ